MLLKNALVFLFGFSLFVVMLNASGLFSVQLQHQNLTTPSVADVTDLTEAPTSASEPGIIGNIVSGVAGFAYSIFTSLFGSVLSVLGVTPLLKAYGIPLYLATMLAGMLSLIAFISLVMLLANRSDKGIS